MRFSRSLLPFLIISFFLNSYGEDFFKKKLDKKLKKIEIWEKKLSKSYLHHFVYENIILYALKVR